LSEDCQSAVNLTQKDKEVIEIHRANWYFQTLSSANGNYALLLLYDGNGGGGETTQVCRQTLPWDHVGIARQNEAAARRTLRVYKSDTPGEP
jgi:hypothetical protein